MFDREYVFRGKHAEEVMRLTAQFEDGLSLFNHNYDVYLMAPIVGFLYQRKADLDSGKTTKIFPDQLISINKELWFNYRLIMLLDENYESDFEKRINKAFRDYGSDKAREDEQLYESYVRGGIDVLYEKLIENAVMPEDYFINLYEFMEEMDDRWNQEVDSDHISELCALASF